MRIEFDDAINGHEAANRLRVTFDRSTLTLTDTQFGVVVGLDGCERRPSRSGQLTAQDRRARLDAPGQPI